MVVTRKVVKKGGKKDDPSTSAEGEDQPEKVLPDVSESEHEGQPEDIQDEDMETVENIKEELEKTEDLGSGKRVSKPTFKVKYSGTKQPGNFLFSTSKILCLSSYAILNMLCVLVITRRPFQICLSHFLSKKFFNCHEKHQQFSSML